jgi:hypothetical protein
MVQIILIEKNGTVKQTNSKDLTKETIYKKCGLKSDGGFKKRTTWNTTVGSEKCSLELWSKDEGKAGTENKFELPEPIDKNLYFGTMAVVRVNSNGNIIDIKTDLWNKVYDKLMGDFDDLDDEEEEEEDDEDELASVSKSMKTKSGYLKDGFVVETNSEDEEYVEEVEEEEEAEDEDDDDDEEDEDSDDLELDDDCSEGSELGEESYEYSDDDDDDDEAELKV